MYILQKAKGLRKVKCVGAIMCLRLYADSEPALNQEFCG